MADIASQETTVLQGHVLRHVHELAKLRGLRGWGVKAESGGHVGQHGAGNMSVDVDAVVYYLDGVETTVATTTNVVVEAAHATLPRIDVLYVSSGGVMTIVKGTAHAVAPTGETVWQKFQLPRTPDLSAIEGVILAEIYVPAAATAILDAHIRMLGVPVSISSAGITIVTTVGDPGDDDEVPSEQAVREMLPGITAGVSTSIATPGVDTKVPTEKAVRSAIAPIVTTIGTPGADTNVPSEQAVREAITDAVGVVPPATNTDNKVPQWDGTDSATLKDGLSLVTTVGDPGSDSSLPTEQAVREALDEVSGGGGASFWTVFPGTPTRVSNTSFSVTDAANENLYDKQFGPGTIIKWEKSGGGFQCAKITGASYSSGTVTYTILGNTLAAAFTDMKYCINPVMEAVFIVPGTLPASAQTNIAKTIHPAQDIYIFSAQAKYTTAPTTTGGTWDINDDGTTIFDTKPPIAAAAKVGTETVCNSLLATATTAVAKDSEITLDYDGGHATTPGADAYVYFWYMPVSWRYRT